jgi:hypothetical protein
MKLWIDDVRPAPNGWVWAKTLDSALRLYLMEAPDEISFDHDLGGDETSMPLAKLIEDNAFNGVREPPRWHVHSANPVGRKNLEAALRNADRYWRQATSSEARS